MLNLLKPLKEVKHDAILFSPTENVEVVRFHQVCYEEPGEDVKTDLGNIYHIFLYKLDKEGQITNRDSFEAVLLDHLEYMSDMVKCQIFGLIAKKTTTSQPLFDRTVKASY